MKNIGIKIRNRRKELGLKVYELAKKVGVNPVYITQIEKHNKLPSVKVYEKISNALNIPSELRSQYISEKYPNIFVDAELSRYIKNPNDNLLINSIMSFMNQIERKFPNKGFNSSMKKKLKAYISILIHEKNPSLASNAEKVKSIEKSLIKICKVYFHSENVFSTESDKIEKLLQINNK